MDAESPRLDSESLSESLWMKDKKRGVNTDEHMKEGAGHFGMYLGERAGLGQGRPQLP